ncbi:acetyltransferase domain-containing protein [Xylaria intraflava]|nr:acetyltransferase domain-containing protein [Xylaria intraflava]
MTIASTEPPQQAPSAAPKIKVKTTWPVVPPSINRTPIRTERLLLRPFAATDVEAIHELRRQPEVMQWTIAGLVDKTTDETRVFIERFLPPKDLASYNFVVVYLGEAGDVVIGCGGCGVIKPELGWPEVGYMFRKEYWGMGFGTEFLRGLTAAWWALPRREVELEVELESVRDGDAAIRAPEVLVAVIENGNVGSRRVLEKAGFAEYKRWTEPDSRAGFEGADASLVKFRLEAPGS